MTIPINPLAQVLREVRHGRVALAEGRLHTAIMCLDCAEIWWGAGVKQVELRVLDRMNMTGTGAPTTHERKRLMLARRVVDWYGAQVRTRTREIPGGMPTNGRP